MSAALRTSAIGSKLVSLRLVALRKPSPALQHRTRQPPIGLPCSHSRCGEMQEQSFGGRRRERHHRGFHRSRLQSALCRQGSRWLLRRLCTATTSAERSARPLYRIADWRKVPASCNSHRKRRTPRSCLTPSATPIHSVYCSTLCAASMCDSFCP